MNPPLVKFKEEYEEHDEYPHSNGSE